MFHGIKINEPAAGVRPVARRYARVIGLVATATAAAGAATVALDAAFPLNRPRPGHRRSHRDRGRRIPRRSRRTDHLSVAGDTRLSAGTGGQRRPRIYAFTVYASTPTDPVRTR